MAKYVAIQDLLYISVEKLDVQAQKCFSKVMLSGSTKFISSSPLHM